MSGKNKYSNTEVIEAVALARLYGNIKKAAKELGISYDTLYNWANKKYKSNEIVDFDRHVAEAYETMLQNNLFLMSESQRVIHEKLPAASAAQAATIYGILFDKNKILMDMSRETVGSGQIPINVEAISVEEQDALIERYMQRKAEAEAIDTEYRAVEASSEEIEGCFIEGIEEVEEAAEEGIEGKKREAIKERQKNENALIGALKSIK